MNSAKAQMRADILNYSGPTFEAPVLLSFYDFLGQAPPTALDILATVALESRPRKRKNITMSRGCTCGQCKARFEMRGRYDDHEGKRERV